MRFHFIGGNRAGKPSSSEQLVNALKNGDITAGGAFWLIKDTLAFRLDPRPW